MSGVFLCLKWFVLKIAYIVTYVKFFSSQIDSIECVRVHFFYSNDAPNDWSLWIKNNSTHNLFISFNIHTYISNDFIIIISMKSKIKSRGHILLHPWIDETTEQILRITAFIQMKFKQIILLSVHWLLSSTQRAYKHFRAVFIAGGNGWKMVNIWHDGEDQ